MNRLLRERGLALVALLLALIGLVAGTGGPGAARAEVVVASRGVATDAVLSRPSLRLVTIAADDVTPGMARRVSDVVGQTARAPISRGDYVLRSAIQVSAKAPVLRAGERAVPISVDAAGAPPLALLGAGVRVDVVAELAADANGPARSQLLAKDLTLLGRARGSDGGIVATVRAPLAVALAVATAQAREHRLRLFVRPAREGGDG